MAESGAATAYEVEERDVYHPEVRPGYAAWVALWRSRKDELMLAFCEKRRLPNPSYRPIPLEFLEAMGLPLKYQVSFCNGSPDVRTESVVMRSHDEGKSWREVGRADDRGLMNVFAYASLSDGSLLRGIDTSYVSFSRDDVPVMGIERSSDDGKSWSLSSVLLEKDWFGCPYRLKRLSDGALVVLCACSSGFGPGRPRRLRGTQRPHVIRELEVMLWITHDEGKSWAGPLVVLPDIDAWEPDFVELASGDLLIVNSTVQGGPAVRQYVHRRGRTFIPGPVSRVVSGVAPETFCVTRSGLLVGATRHGPYTCSNDEGATWHEISGLPRCNYQPQIIELADGRLLCAWHMHGDCVFGEHHQFVGQHVFALDASGLPAATRLDLARDMDREETRYINSCSAHLEAAGSPLAGRKIRFWTQMRYHDTFDLSPPSPEPKEIVKATDTNGNATLELEELYPGLDAELNIHQSYTVKASFQPDEGDRLTPAASPSFHAYIMSPAKLTKNSYPLYVAGKKLFFDPRVLEEVAELPAVVEGFGKSRDIDTGKVRQKLSLDKARLERLVGFLVSRHLVERSGSSGYRWRYDLGDGAQQIEVSDDFV